MSQLYRVYCNDEQQFVFIWTDVEPTTCPNNAAHSVNPNGINVMDLGTTANSSITYDGYGNIVIGSTDLGIGATNGFLYMPTGSAFGVPTTYDDKIPTAYDTETGSLQTYTNGNWVSVGAVDNIGADGVGLFKQIINGVSQLRNVSAGSNKISITLDAVNNTVDVDCVPANISIGSLSGAPTSAVVGISDVQTLTNKTIISNTNTVAASHIQTSGSPVALNTTAPKTGQVLTATSETAAEWEWIGLKAAVRVASNCSISLSSNLVGTTMDGVTLTVGMRILLKDQDTASQNGIYIVGSGAGATTRAPDMPVGSNVSMCHVLVQNSAKAYICTNNSGSDVVGTNSLTWVLLSNQSSGSYGYVQLCGSTAGSFDSDTYLQWNKTKNCLLIGTNPSNLSNIPFDINISVNGYLQGNIQNLSNNNGASSDWVATCNTGSDSSGFINLGINSSNYNQSSYSSGGPGDGYLLMNGGDLALITETTNNIGFFTGGATSSDERMKIYSNGNVSIGLAALNTGATNGFLYLPGCAGTPTGNPTTLASRTPIVVDTSNELIYARLGGAWKPLVGSTQTQTLTNKTLTSPKVDQLLDTGGNESLVLTATASAVNYLTLANAATGSGPTLTAGGSDTNINLDLISKGTGAVQIKNTSSSTAGELRLYENSSSGTNYVGLKAPTSDAGFTANATFTLPSGYGANGQYLMTSGAGGLSWGTPPSSAPGSVYTNTTATATYTTTSTSYTVITGMTVTPASGTYMVMFSTSCSTGSNTKFTFGIGVDGAVDTTSVRSISTGGSQTANMILGVNSIAIATVNGSQAIDARVLRTTGSGTLRVYERSLYIYKLA